SSGEPDTGEPDAIKVARPVREGAVGNLRKPVAPVARRRESQQGAGRLLHTLGTSRQRQLANARAKQGAGVGEVSGVIPAHLPRRGRASDTNSTDASNR